MTGIEKENRYSIDIYGLTHGMRYLCICVSTRFSHAIFTVDECLVGDSQALALLFFQGGWTCMHWAALKGRTDVMTYLISINRKGIDAQAEVDPLILILQHIIHLRLKYFLCLDALLNARWWCYSRSTTQPRCI